jgi:WD40 repeat protein
MSPDQLHLAAGRGDHVLIFDLAKKERPIELELQTPNDLVQALVWSDDGKQLASAGFRTVRLWDLKSQSPLRTFGGFAGRVTALAFTPDALLAGEGEPAYPGLIHAWDRADGRELRTWPAHADAVLAMKVSRDGKRLVTAGADKLVKIWQLPEGTEISKLEGHVAQVMAVALNADGSKLASAGADKEIKIWDPKTREQTAALVTNPGGVTDLAWVDDKVICSTCEDGIARYSALDNKERAQKTFTGAPDVLYAACIGKDNTLYAACHDGFVYLWDANNVKLVGKLPADQPRSGDRP